ncbi:unnamed protein product (macronuclear) [Paramecium tetraurelia]|uniref:Uncharacterized protein n=1 Tax=Paramecium tetraurelia TaxID=5888 RepID=A0CJ81_PARTE|nr:uncharacterized protein GSPATT00038630001 [Paramecium tetraurelia]CAK70848.1 unnamed protein product [Paramecium tetraurelia]|eukprot:XP_001438245.1 hypothetical protein (macronuclear) [Paramecium tetraurelia strain d4-2]
MLASCGSQYLYYYQINRANFTLNLTQIGTSNSRKSGNPQMYSNGNPILISVMTLNEMLIKPTKNYNQEDLIKTYTYAARNTHIKRSSSILSYISLTNQDKSQINEIPLPGQPLVHNLQIVAFIVLLLEELKIQKIRRSLHNLLSQFLLQNQKFAAQFEQFTSAPTTGLKCVDVQYFQVNVGCAINKQDITTVLLVAGSGFLLLVEEQHNNLQTSKQQQ